MAEDLALSPVGTLTPVRSDERIQALDVVRGFALLGIFLMNVEWFNRASSEMMLGLPSGLSGANWWASRLIFVLVQGKFWTMFSLLFGMGFAVMLTRAEQAGRNFLRPYLRRIAALALFGAVHHILLWSGDILFSYSVAAMALLIVLFGRWKWVVGSLVALIGLGFIPKANALWQVAGSLAYVSVVAMYLRGEKRLSLKGHSLPVFAFVTLVIGALTGLAAAMFWMLPHAPKEPRVPVLILSVMILSLGTLAARYHQAVEPRMRRLGVTLYLLPFITGTVFGVAQKFRPEPPVPVAQAPVVSQAQQSSGAKQGDKKVAKTDAQRAAEEEVERTKRIKARQDEIRTETQVLSKGSYRDVVKLRAKQFAENAPNETGFAVVVIGMFLLGAWFVRSGVMTNTRDHLPLFRKLAWVALPVGVGMGLAGSALATSHVLGDQKDWFQVASGLLMMGNLPACLGYVSVIVLMLHSDTPFSKVKVLAPVGRMALTNYLLQSVISSLFFFGYAGGHWGMGRAWQVVYVFVIYSLQIPFSHWWLGKFRYGPMEWLWRAITYWTIPPMRLGSSRTAGPMLPVESLAP